MPSPTPTSRVRQPTARALATQKATATKKAAAEKKNKKKAIAATKATRTMMTAAQEAVRFEGDRRDNARTGVDYRWP